MYNFIDPEKRKDIINTQEILIKPVIKTDEIKVLSHQIKIIPNVKDLKQAINKLKPIKHLEY